MTTTERVRPACATPGCGREIPVGGEGHPEICPTCLACLKSHGEPAPTRTQAHALLDDMERDRDAAVKRAVVDKQPPGSVEVMPGMFATVGARETCGHGQTVGLWCARCPGTTAKGAMVDATGEPVGAPTEASLGEQLDALLKEAGVRPYWKRAMPGDRTRCIHGNPMGPFCADCAKDGTRGAPTEAEARPLMTEAEDVHTFASQVADPRFAWIAVSKPLGEILLRAFRRCSAPVASTEAEARRACSDPRGHCFGIECCYCGLRRDPGDTPGGNHKGWRERCPSAPDGGASPKGEP